jgi:hypothetical protein
MIDIFAAVLAFLICTLFTLLELVTSKYPTTFFLLKDSKSLYAYGIIYGFLAVGIYFLLPTISSQATLSGIGVTNPWVRAVAIGLTVKAFFHVRLFDVSTGPGKSYPFGIESIVQIFEPWLLRTIDLNHFASSRIYLQARAVACPIHDIEGVRSHAIAQIPDKFTDADKSTMTSDLQKADSVEKILGVYLTYTGKRTLESVFSQPDTAARPVVAARAAAQPGGGGQAGGTPNASAPSGSGQGAVNSSGSKQ